MCTELGLEYKRKKPHFPPQEQPKLWFDAMMVNMKPSEKVGCSKRVAQITIVNFQNSRTCDKESIGRPGKTSARDELLMKSIAILSLSKDMLICVNMVKNASSMTASHC